RLKMIWEVFICEVHFAVHGKYTKLQKRIAKPTIYDKLSIFLNRFKFFQEAVGYLCFVTKKQEHHGKTHEHRTNRTERLPSGIGTGKIPCPVAAYPNTQGIDQDPRLADQRMCFLHRYAHQGCFEEWRDHATP